MRTSCYSFGQGAAAVLIEAADLAGRELSITFLFIWFQCLRAQEWNLLLQNRPIPGQAHIMSGDIGQPDHIVGTARAQSASCRRMPPVQHITLLELMSR